MTKVNGNNNVSAEYKIVNGKKVKKQEQSKNQKQVFNNKGQKTPQKPNDSAIKQEVYKKSGYQLKDTKDRNKIIQLKVNGKIRSYKTVGTLTTGGRILVQDEKGAYHVVSHTKDNKLIMLKDDYAKNKIFYESTSSEHKVKYGKKNYVITNSKRDRHGRMSAIDENGKRVVLSSDGKELKTGYVEAEDQKDNMNDYIAKQTKGKSKAEADKIRQQILSGNSSYSNKGVLRFKASNGEVWYYDTKRKTYVKYAEKEAQAIIKNLDKGATENWLLFRTGLGTDYELLKNTNAQIIDPEVLGKVNKHYSAEYGNKVDKNAQYGSGKYKTAYEAFLASEIGDDEVYQFNAALVKNNAITDQSRRNEILQTNLTKVGSRANRLAAADAASRKEDYQTLQDAAEEENKKKNYKAPFKGSDALQTYIYGVNNGDVQEIDDFNTTLIDPKEDMLDRDEIVKIKAETGALWAKQGKYDKAFEAQDGEIVDKMFALQDANGKASLNVKELKAKAKGFQGEYLMFAKPELFTEQELADKAVSMLNIALSNLSEYESVSPYVDDSQMAQNKAHNLSQIQKSISKAYTLIRNDKVLKLVKQKMGDKFNLLQKKEQEKFGTDTFADITVKNESVKSNLSAEQVAQNKYVVSWLKSQLEDLERDKKLNEQKEGWKQSLVNNVRTEFRLGETKASLANKYDLIKSNMSRLEAAAEGKLVDKNGKPVSFEDAMKNLGETGIKALEKANQDYQSAQAKGEFVVDMAVLAIPIPGLSVGNIVKMAGTLYKVVGTSGKMYKVVKVTAEAVKGQKILNYAVKTAESSATGAMHMAGKTFALEASNIATSREGFTADRISEMNQKTQSAAVFGGMGGAIGGTTAVASEYVSSAGAKYAVHGVGLVADLMGAAGLMTAESHGETNFWDNLRCVNPDGSFNFEQASMTAMMIFGHLHGMSAIKGKPMPKAEIQADGTVKYTLNNNELKLNKDGIYTDSETGRKFRLATNKNSKTELVELTKKEIYNSRQKTEVKDGMTLEDFRQELKNNDLRGDVYTKADGGKLVTVKHSRNKYELFEFDNNNNMISKKSVVGKSAINESYPEFANAESSGTMGSTSGYLGMNKTGITGNKPTNVKKVQDKVNKKELTALRNKLGIYQTQKGSRFEYVPWADGSSGFIHEKRGNDTVTSYYVVRNAEGKAYIQQKFLLEKGKAIDAESYKADGSVIEDKRVKQLVLENTNKIIQQEILDKIQKEMTLDECKKLSKQYDNIELNELNNGAYEVKFDFATWGKDMGGPEKSFYERLDAMASLDKEIEVVTAVHNKTGQVIKLTIKYQLGNSRDIEYNNAGKKTKETVKDAEGKITGVFDGDGKPLEIPNEVKEEVKQTGSEVSAEGSQTTPKTEGKTEQTPVNANEGKSETKATETKSAAESNSESYNPAQRAEKFGLKPSKEGNRIDFETFTEEKHPQFVEVDSNGNPVKRFIVSFDQNGKPFVDVRATYKNGEIVLREQLNEFGEVVAREIPDNIPVNLSNVDSFLKEYPDFVKSEADGVVTITNKKANLTIEYDKNTGKKVVATQVDQDGLVVRNTFNEDGFIATRESDFVYEGNRYHEFYDVNKGTKSYQQILDKNTGISTEVKSELAQKFAEGTVDEGKFTPKEAFSPYEVIEQNAGKPTKTALKDGDGNVLEYNYNEYDSNGNVAKTTSKDVTGKVTASHEFEYDSSHNLIKETVKDANGKITEVLDGKGNPLKTESSQPVIDKPVGEDSQVTGEQKKSSLILPGDESKPAHIKTVDEFAQEDRQPAKFQTKEELEASDRKSVQIKTEKDFVKEDNKPVKIKTEEQFAKEDGVEIDSSNTTTEEVAKQPIKLDLDTKSSRGDIDAKSHYEVMADKVIVDGEEFPIPQTLEEAKNTKALRHFGGGIEYSIEYTSDIANSTNRVILKYDTKSGKFIGSTELINKNGSALKDTYRNADGTLDKTIDYLHTDDGTQVELHRDSNGKPTNINWKDNHITFDKEGKASYTINDKPGKPIEKSIEEVFKDSPELKPLLKKQGIKLVEKKAEPTADASAEKANATEESATGNTVDEAVNINNEEVAKAESGAITGDETPVTTEESAPAGESTPVSENSKTADAKPSKISMFDKLFHRNKARLEKEVANGEEKIGDYKFNTVKDENGYVRTKTNNTGKIEGKEYFNAKGKKIKTEVYYDNGNIKELTEGNVTTKYYANKNVHTVVYPNHKTVEFVYDENGNLTAKYTEEISKAREFARSITAEENEFGEYEYDTIKRRTNYTYNSKKDRFELLNDKKEVVGTATFDPETRHWVEDGQYSSDLAPKTTNVSRGEGRFRIKLPERNKVPKNLRDENGKLREGVKPFNDGYTETISKEGVEITKAYDSKGTLLLEVSKEKATYYNAKGEVIAEEKPTPNGTQRTEFSKDYDLDVLFNSHGEGEKITIKYHKDKKGNTAKPEKFIYDKDNNVYESQDKGKDGKAVKTLDYDAKNHSWTIKDAKGYKLDSQNNMKESHIKRNIGIGAGVLAVGLGAYGISKLVKSDDDKEVKQSDNPAIAEQVAKTIAKQAANAKAETKVTLDGKEGTIAEDGTLTLDGKPYPKAEDGTYTIGDKKYKVEDGKLVEVVDTPDDNGETGGADGTDGTAEVKGTVDGKEYTIHSDGSATIGGHQYDKLEDGYYHTEDGSIYGVGEDGKLVKIDKTQAGSDGSQAGSAGSATQTGNDSAQAGSAGSATQTGSDSAQAGSAGSATQTGSDSAQSGSAGSATQTGSDSAQSGSAGATSQQTGNTNTTGNNTHVTTRPSGQSEESRRTGNTPVTGGTEPTQEQKQVAKTLQDEISSISTQADVKAFFAKAISAYNAGKITLMQLDVLKTQVANYVETLNEAIKIQNEQDAIQKPEFGLGEVTTQEPQPKEKREITPVERMDLTESIRKAKNREDIAKIQQEMRKYKVFQGRKNLRRAYKAKLRAIKHQDEPQKVEKYNKKFEKRMEKIEDSKVYEQDTKEILINNEFKIDKKMWDSENFYT